MSDTTFRHSSARVPRLYKEAGRIVQKVREEGGSFKGLVYQSKHRSLKSLYALVAETLRHGSELDALLRKTSMLLKEPRLDPWLARVLITELLWRNRPLAGPAMPLKIVQSYKPQLLSNQADMPPEVTKSVSRASRPRFVRVNTLRATEEEVLDFFAKDGWKVVGYDFGHNNCSDDEKYAEFLKRISVLSKNEFVRDIHIKNLFIFPGNMEFYNLEYYHNSLLLLQDKASCMAAHLLDPPPGSVVLDMCAAPGMKTTHAAAILGNKGTLYAIEKHQGRYESLCKVVSQAGADCVKPILGSALDFSENELHGVEYIMVDPTCSGSGMTDRKEIFNDLDDVSKIRLEKLASFQCAILRHAMTNFPNVKRIVYSTCSIHPEENEAVIEEVLASTPPNFEPIIPSDGTQWMKKGSSLYKWGEYGLYARPEVDLTNGFFVVVFERTENDYVVGKMILNSANDGPSEIKKKKREKRSSLKEKGSSSTDTSTNPALERMKKAMSNFCAADKGYAGVVASEQESKRKKKRKEIHEDNQTYDVNGELVKKRKAKKVLNVEAPDEAQTACVMEFVSEDTEKGDHHRGKKKGSKSTLVPHLIPDAAVELRPSSTKFKKKRKISGLEQI